MEIFHPPPARGWYAAVRPGTIIVWSSWKCVLRIPSGAKIRSSANSRSERPLTRLTITASSVYPVFEYAYSSPGRKLTPFWRATIDSTSRSVMRSSWRQPA